MRLLETEAPQKDNQMGQSGPSPRFGKPEGKLQYEPNIGSETASPFGLESWSDAVQFLSQEQPTLFEQPEPEPKGIKVKMILVSVPAISSVKKQHLEKSKPKKIHCPGWRVPGSPKDKLSRPQELELKQWGYVHRSGGSSRACTGTYGEQIVIQMVKPDHRAIGD